MTHNLTLSLYGALSYVLSLIISNIFTKKKIPIDGVTARRMVFVFFLCFIILSLFEVI